MTLSMILDLIRFFCLLAVFAGFIFALNAGYEGVQWLSKWDEQTSALQQDAVAAYATAHFAFAGLCVLVAVLALWGWRAVTAWQKSALHQNE